MLFRQSVLVLLAVLAGAVLMSASSEAAAQADGGATDRNRALVAQSFDAWRDGTGSPYDLLADDASWTITGNSLAARTYQTKADFIEQVIRPFNARMTGRLIPTVRRLYADGDTIVVFFDAVGTARDGQAYTNTYVWILAMKDGRIVQAHAFFDSIAFDDLWRRVPAVE